MSERGRTVPVRWVLSLSRPGRRALLVLASLALVAGLLGPIEPTEAQSEQAQSEQARSAASDPASAAPDRSVDTGPTPRPAVHPARWRGDQETADPSNGQAEYEIDPDTGRIVWPDGTSGHRDDGRIAPYVPTPLNEAPSSRPVDDIDGDVPEITGFEPGASAYRDDLATDRVHVWDNPDGSRTVQYGTGPFEVDRSTGAQLPIESGLTRDADGALEWRAGDRTLTVPAVSRAERGGNPPMVASLQVDGQRFEIGYEGQVAVPVGRQAPASAGPSTPLTGSTQALPGLDDPIRVPPGSDKRPPAPVPQVAVAKDLVGGADVEISPLSQGIKVNVVASTTEEATGLVEILTVPPGWSMRQGAGLVELLDPDGEVAGAWGGGEGYDSAPTPSETWVTVELLSFENGVGRAAIVVDDEWLQSPDRVFPLVLDPSVVVGTLADTRVVAGSGANTNYSTSSYLNVGSYQGAWSRVLMKFDDPVYGASRPGALAESESFSLESNVGLTDGVRISDARLRMWNQVNTAVSCSNPVQTYARRVTNGWSSTGVTWNNKPGTTDANRANAGFVSCSPGWVTMNVTGIVSSWRNAGTPNYGIELRSAETSGQGLKQYYSENYSTSYQPVLEVTFHPYDARYTRTRYGGDQGTILLPNPATGGNGVLPVRVMNRGDLNWTSTSTCLAYHVQYSGGPASGWRVTNGNSTCPGGGDGGLVNLASFIDGAHSGILAPSWWPATLSIGVHGQSPGLYDVYPAMIRHGVTWFENQGVSLGSPARLRWSAPPRILEPNQPIDPNSNLTVRWATPYASGQAGYWNPSHYRYQVRTTTDGNNWTLRADSTVGGSTTSTSLSQGQLGSWSAISVCLTARDQGNENAGWEHWTDWSCVQQVKRTIQVEPEDLKLGLHPLADEVAGVNVASGNWFRPLVDLNVVGLNDQFGLTRNLNSRSTDGGIFGPGFTTAAESYLQVLPDDEPTCVSNPKTNGCLIKLLEADAASMFLVWDSGANAYTDLGQTPTRLVEVGGGLELRYQNGSKQHFTGFSGGVARTTGWSDLDGHRLRVDRDSSRNHVPWRLVDEGSGRELILSYTNQGSGNSPIWVVNKAHVMNGGQELAWTYSYSNGRMTQACQPNGGCQTYTFDSSSRIKTVQWPNGSSTRVTLNYDGDDRVTSRVNGLGETTGFAYNSDTRTTVTDGRGTNLVYEFDSDRRQTSFTDGLGRTTSYRYDSHGNRDQTTDANGNTATLVYDANANLLSETNGAGETTTYRYESGHYGSSSATRTGPSHICDPRQTSNGTQYCVIMYYDSAGRMTSRAEPGETSSTRERWVYTSGSEGAVGGGTTPPGLLASYFDGIGTTTYRYDSAGNRAEERTALGAVTSWSHDGIGRVTEERSTYDGNPTLTVNTIVYDRLRLQSETGPVIDNPVTGTSHQNQRSFSYDANGNLTHQDERDVLAANSTRTSSFSYDGLDREVSSVMPDGAQTSRTFDAAGNVVTVTDAEGNTVRSTFDAANRVTRVEALSFDDGHGTVATRRLTDHSYDAAGRLITQTEHFDGSSSLRTDHVYDAADRVIEIRKTNIWDGVSTQVIAERNTYDSAGFLITKVVGNAAAAADGQDRSTTTYTYHDDARVHTTTVGDRTVSSTYDPAGNIVDLVTSGTDGLDGSPTTSAVETVYNPAGQPIETRVDNGAEQLVTHTFYDQRGLEIGSTPPRGADDVVVNPGGSTIVVRARGNAGTEDVDLTVNGQAVASWPVSTSDQTFTYQSSSPVAALRVGHDSGDWPSAVIVDYVEVDGVRYESEAAGVYSVGSWDQATSCAAGYKQSEWLSCDNAYFEYPVGGPSTVTITVRARGNQGSEEVDLTVNGQAVASWPVSTSDQSFTFEASSEVTSVRVGHDSGGWPSAVIVDYVEVDGTRYESEDSSVYSVGSWDSVNGCAAGYKQSPWLSCDNAYFDYAIAPTGGGGGGGGGGGATPDPTDFTTISSYDLLGRLIEVQSPVVDLAYAADQSNIEANWVDQAGQRPTATTGYDAFGNITHLRRPSGAVTVTTYDEVDRRIRVDHPTYVTPAGASISASETWSYTLNGNVASYTDRAGDLTTFAYDSANRVVRTTEAAIPRPDNDALLQPQGVTLQFYDRAGRMTSAVDAEGSTTVHGYDSLGRLRRQTMTVRAVADQPEMTAMVETDYSWLGYVTSIDDGTVVSSSTYDVFGNLLSESVGSLDPATHAYDGVGRLRQRVEPDGSKAISTYDQAGRLVALEHRAADDSLIGSWSYGHDENGNQVSETSPRGFTSTFTYDRLDRLTSVTTPETGSSDITTSYTYDRNGNLSSYTDGDGHTYRYRYNAYDLQSHVVEPSATSSPVEPQGDRTFSFTYDGAGRPIEEDQPGGRRVLREFNALGQIESEIWTEPGSIVAVGKDWGYDRVGRPVRGSHPVAPITFTYDDRGLLVATDGGAGTTRAVHDVAGRQVSRSDASGSQVVTYDVNGDVESIIQADPSGDPLTPTKTVTVQATSTQGQPRFGLEVAGIPTDGTRTVTASGGQWQLETFEVPSARSIDDLLVRFDGGAGGGGPSTVEVIATGNAGGESITLSIDGVDVDSWLLDADSGFYGSSPNYQSYLYQHSSTITTADLAVTFDNDGTTPSGGDKNVRVDAIVVDGVRYESEDPSVLVSGAYVSGVGCTSGYLGVERISCNGGFEYAVSNSGNPGGGPGATITVRARGNQGSEEVDLTVNGQAVASWPVSTSDQSFTFEASSEVTSVRVGHDSGGWPSAVIVDYVEVDGTRYESEDSSVYSVGSWDSVNGCAAGYKQSPWLSCDNAYFDYAIAPTGGGGGGGGTSSVEVIAVARHAEAVAELWIDGAKVDEWEPTVDTSGFHGSPPNWHSHTYTHNGGIGSAELRVQLAHGGSNSSGQDRDIRVDAVVVDGTRYETEDPAVYSTGTWNNGAECNGGNWSSEYLHCTGYLQYDVEGSGGGGGPAGLRIGSVEIDGVQYQASDGEVAKRGVTALGCETVTYDPIDTLDCAGSFDFSGVTDQSNGGPGGVVEVAYRYDSATGQPTGIDYPGGGSRTFVYDSFGRVVLDELTNASGSVTASLSYGWSCEGDLIHLAQNLPGNGGSGDQTFTYDRSGRLSSWNPASSPGAATTCGEGSPSGETYSYDRRGNRLTAGARTFTYDNRNRLTSDPDGSYAWSPAGAMETFTANAGGSEVFTRDAAHRLIGVDDGTDSVAYDYDGLDRIASRNGSETFAYAGTGIDPAADGVDGYARTSSQGLFALEPAGGGFLFPMTNLHGDVVGWVDTAGELVGAATYDPFGQVDDITGTSSRLGFQSDWTEPDNGRVWMGARWYQPSSATFLTRDTYFGELGTPFSLNRYTYAVNNPTRYWDPDGRCPLITCNFNKFLEINGVRPPPKASPPKTSRPPKPKGWSQSNWNQFIDVNVDPAPAPRSSQQSKPSTVTANHSHVANLLAINSGPEPPPLTINSFDNTVLPGETPWEAWGMWQTLSDICPYCEGYNIEAGGGLACYGLSGCTEAAEYMAYAYADGDLTEQELSEAKFIAATYCQYNNCGAGNARTLENHIQTTAAFGDAILAFGGGSAGRSLLSSLLRRNTDDALRTAAGGADDAGRQAAGAAARDGISSPATGNPSAIARGFADLSGGQQTVLSSLPDAGSAVVVPKRSFQLNDLAALTAATGDEFAMFTTGGRRLIIRGTPSSVPVDVAHAQTLAQQGWRWSAHTHPGSGQAVLSSSVGDRTVLTVFGGRQSAILNSMGDRGLFTPSGDYLGGWLP